ncbi:MAG TPA: glycosyltransferase family 1 protein [Abditibacterium sp.]|jgi:glycosyltransferase involved in cell wall biosynthesis
MKIAFDATALYGPLGGIENALWQTFSRLRALDNQHDTLVFVPRDAPEPPAPFNPRWTWHRLPFDGADKLRRIVWQQFELPFWLRRHPCDLLHAWNYVAPLLSPIPVVLTVQDLIALNRPRFASRFNRWHYRAAMPQSLKRAARVIVSTPQTHAEVLRRAPNAEVRVVPLGLDPIFRVEPANLLQIREKYALPPRFLLYVGNFEPKKNLPNLLRALRMRPDFPPLIVAGGIKPWPKTQELLRGVQNLGFVARDDLPALYASCEAFCFPSRCEGFGLPVLEALACGAPTLASTQVPLPGLGEVAALCEPQFPLSIAHQLDTLLNDSPRAAPKVAARREFATRFSWDSAARQILALYREFS